MTTPRFVPARVALLDADPDLAAGLDADNRSRAGARAIAAVLDLEPPTWDPCVFRDQADETWLGLFVLEGLMMRRVTIGKRPACELFGPGDVFRPWDSDGEYYPLPITVDWHVLRPTRIAQLDGGFAARIAAWPSINSKIVSRVAQRARYLALTQAATHLPRASSRLLILFWLMAERWGRVGRDGVHIALPLTHEVLAMIAGTHRPTITLALQRLTRAGLLVRERQDLWLLTNDAIARLEQPDQLDLVESGDDEPVLPYAGDGDDGTIDGTPEWAEGPGR